MFSGELTELGACTLGWDLSDMASNLFTAVIGSCLGDCPCKVPACACKAPPGRSRVDISPFVEDLKRRQVRWEAKAAADEERWANDRDGGDEEDGYDGDDGKYSGGGGGGDESDGESDGESGSASGSASGAASESDAEKKKRRNKAKSDKKRKKKNAAAAAGNPPPP